MQSDETQNSDTYYALNREARKQYQRDYYRRNKKVLARKRELQPVLDPERAEQIRDYQRAYYLSHRQELLAKRRERERRKRAGRNPVSGILNPESGILNPESGILNPENATEQPETSAEHPSG
jgi:type II secretory pathway component PulJ